MIVKVLTEHHLEFLSLKGECTGSSESTHVKIPHCWKSQTAAQMFFFLTGCHHLDYPLEFSVSCLMCIFAFLPTLQYPKTATLRSYYLICGTLCCLAVPCVHCGI